MYYENPPRVRQPSQRYLWQPELDMRRLALTQLE
jgi:hypothetical protein